MVKSSCLLTFLSLFFLQLPLAEANEENLKLVTSTGRAAIISDEQIQETRSRALEDALYSAALLGGAEIDGFSSVQAGTELDDHFVVRPSSKIVDYDIEIIPWAHYLEGCDSVIHLAAHAGVRHSLELSLIHI